MSRSGLQPALHLVSNLSDVKLNGAWGLELHVQRMEYCMEGLGFGSKHLMTAWLHVCRKGCYIQGDGGSEVRVRGAAEAA